MRGGKSTYSEVLKTRVVFVQSFSCVWPFVTTWTAARWASLSFTTSWSLLKLVSIESVMPSNHLVLHHPLLLLPSVFPSIRVFSSQLFPSGAQSIGASVSVLPMNIQDWFPLGLPGLISLQSKGLPRVFSKTTVQNINSSVLSFLYGTTITFTCDYWKTIALTTWILVGKVMSLPFNMLSILVINILSRSNCFLILWLQSPSAVILEPPPPNKVSHCFHCFPIHLPWSDGTGWHDLSFLNVEF